MAHSPPNGGSKSHKKTKDMHREKITFLKIFITVLLLASFPVTIILTNSGRNTHDIRSKATSPTETADKIMFIPLSFSKDQDDEDIFDFRNQQTQIRNGFVPENTSSNAPLYTAKIYRNDGTFTEKKFSLPQFVAIDSFDQSTGRSRAELKKVTGNSFGITLPYVSGAYRIQIINPKGEIVAGTDATNSTIKNNIIDWKKIRGDEVRGNQSTINPLFIGKAFAANGTFNIAIIGDNYNGDNLHFQADVNDIATGLVSIEPFKTYKANLVFYTQLSAVQICTYSTNLTCNDTLALQQASGLPYDKVYVLYNGPYGGFAYLGATLAYGTNATGMATTVKQGLFIHELAGHTLGGLMDEYSYGTTGASYAPNCSDSSSCPAWNTITGLGCFSSCGFTNLYRATDNASVMNTAFLNGIINFDAFSTQVVAGKLVSYFNVSPPTTTIPPPQPTPTITLPPPTPTNTPTPTVSAIPTPTSSALSPLRNAAGSLLETTISATPTSSPSPTPTPSLTITPTPTQLMGCNFPNFCTREKFCAPENTLAISCSGSALICCKGQTPSSADVTPTITQKFSLLPTMPVIAQDESNSTSTPIPTSAIITPSISIPTPTIQPTQQQIIQNVSFQGIPPSPTVQINQEPLSTPMMAAKPTLKPQESYPVYPTSTPYVIEKIVFERATPTPQPKLEIVDILAAPSRFINNLVKNFFSIFRRN